jgi:hypothetical protein
MKDIHSCSYFCERPECVKAQRDELRDKLAALEERLEIAETNNLNDTIAFNMLRKEHAELEAKLAGAEADTKRIDLLDEWIANSKARGFRWNTFLFFVDKSARRQIDAELTKGGNNDW